MLSISSLHKLMRQTWHGAIFHRALPRLSFQCSVEAFAAARKTHRRTMSRFETQAARIALSSFLSFGFFLFFSPLLLPLIRSSDPSTCAIVRDVSPFSRKREDQYARRAPALGSARRDYSHAGSGALCETVITRRDATRRVLTFV